MKAFRSSVALHSGRYAGRPVPAHLRLRTVAPRHVAVWLARFRETLAEVAPTPLAAAHFADRAERLAESLQLAMFGPTRPFRQP